MKLTRNEIWILLNYYQGREFDITNQINNFNDNCHEIIDSDLCNIQLNRYKSKRKMIKDRVAELQTELDKLY